MKRYRGVWLRMGALALCCVMALTATSCMALTKEYLEDAEGKIPEVTIPTLDDYIGEDVLTTAPTTTTTTAATTTTTTTRQNVVYKYVVADGGLRMREQPNANGAIILTIPTKSRVMVLEEQNDWSYVRYKSKEGWCANSWLFDSIAAATTTAKPVILDEKEALDIAENLIENYAMDTFVLSEIAIERFNDDLIIATVPAIDSDRIYRFQIKRDGNDFIITTVDY